MMRETLPDLARKVGVWVAASAITAGGATIIHSASTISAQAQQIAAIKTTQKNLTTATSQLGKDVQQLNVNTAVLTQELKDGRR